MTLISPFSMGRLKRRSRTFKLRRWALSVWNSSVKHNTHFLSDYMTHRTGNNSVKHNMHFLSDYRTGRSALSNTMDRAETVNTSAVEAT